MDLNTIECFDKNRVFLPEVFAGLFSLNTISTIRPAILPNSNEYDHRTEGIFPLNTKYL